MVMAEHVLITHTDFDGRTCAILFRTAFPNGQVYYAEPPEASAKIREALEKHPEAEIFVTDLEIKDQETWNLIRESERTIVCDHHKETLKQPERPWIYRSATDCGAAVFFEYLWNRYNCENDIWAKLLKLTDLVHYANDYDTWRHTDPLSAKWNTLLWLVGSVTFEERFLINPHAIMTETEEALVGFEEDRRDRYIEEAAQSATLMLDPEGRWFVLVFAEQYISMLGHRLLDYHEQAEYAVLIDMQRKKVHLRGRTSGVDVGAIAKRLGGGGHAASAGFTYTAPDKGLEISITNRMGLTDEQMPDDQE